MKQLKKIGITPFFGDLPEWMPKFKKPVGYDWLLDTDIERFKERVKRVLNIDYPGLPGTGKVWDYRCALGLLYADEIKGYDYWATWDFDMIFGDVGKWFPDELIAQYDVISNHHSYVNGCFSLYSNIKRVNELFTQFPSWKVMLDRPHPNGWVENEYSRLLEQSGLPYRYFFYQGWPYTTEPHLWLDNREAIPKLYQDHEEIAMFHFRRSKKWPI